MVKLRKGRTKSILLNAMDAALLAVETYNRPRATFRSQCYVTLMITAWTYLFHAYFNHTIGYVYFYKTKKSRYEIVDGERRAWELKTCIVKYEKLPESVKANLEFFIGLRNKIEHRTVDKWEVDALIFGECQSLLYNYENFLVQLFGDDYSINENLVYSLQFSKLRKAEQLKANKEALLPTLRGDVKNYVDTFRKNLSDDVFNSQEYSIKLIQIPKVSNTNRNEFAIQFIKWDELNDMQKMEMEKVLVLVKDATKWKEAVNVRRFRPPAVRQKVDEICKQKLSSYDHCCLYSIFGVRPLPSDSIDPSTTNNEYCFFDQAHQDYIYTQKWIDLLVDLFQSGRLTINKLRELHQQGSHIDINHYHEQLAA